MATIILKMPAANEFAAGQFAGPGGKTNWLWLLKWKRNSNIKPAKARTAAASGALWASFGSTMLNKSDDNIRQMIKIRHKTINTTKQVKKWCTP